MNTLLRFQQDYKSIKQAGSASGLVAKFKALGAEKESTFDLGSIAEFVPLKNGFSFSQKLPVKKILEITKKDSEFGISQNS